MNVGAADQPAPNVQCRDVRFVLEARISVSRFHTVSDLVTKWSVVKTATVTAYASRLSSRDRTTRLDAPSRDNSVEIHDGIDQIDPVVGRWDEQQLHRRNAVEVGRGLVSVRRHQFQSFLSRREARLKRGRFLSIIPRYIER